MTNSTKTTSFVASIAAAGLAVLTGISLMGANQNVSADTSKTRLIGFQSEQQQKPAKSNDTLVKQDKDAKTLTDVKTPKDTKYLITKEDSKTLPEVINANK